MSFHEKKFNRLSQKQKAKKAADILKEILLKQADNSHIDTSDVEEEYNRLALWIEPDNRSVLLLPNLQNAEELYLHWRNESNLGAEKEVLALQTETDRAEPLAEKIHWDVLLYNIRSAHNTGSMIRIADCFGLGNIYLSGYTPDKDHAGVKSSAMGTEKWANIIRVENIEEFLKNTTQNRTIVTIENRSNSIPVFEYDWPESGILIPGNERFGVDPFLLENSHATVHIPMYGRKNSLNVANAFAVIAYELRRKRSEK